MERYGDSEIIEVPVHWSLNDFSQLATTSYTSSPMRDPAAIVAGWRREVRLAVEEKRSIALTCHPEVIGRAGPMECFSAFLRELREEPKVELVRCIDIARAFPG